MSLTHLVATYAMGVFEKVVIGGLLVLGPLATIAYFTVFDAPWFTWVGLGLFCAVIAGVAGFGVSRMIRRRRLSPVEKLQADRAEGRGTIWLATRFAADRPREHRRAKR